ncbi:hypothetical protein RYX36_015559 [Vicia faba]
MNRQVLPPLPKNASTVDPKIWRAIAGAAVHIPAVNSRVYYFPQGHMDQASSPPSNLSPQLLSRPYILCSVSAVHFLADPKTDEVFAKLFLQPLNDFAAIFPRVPAPEADDGERIFSFAKILTPSDANNGGGFSVPRFCADSIFPPLDYSMDPPYQSLVITDVHGMAWEFRHIYRGTPRRHLLTTGWSRFVNGKKLVAGDSVVFMKNTRGVMFIGIRRAVRYVPARSANDAARLCLPICGVRNRVDDEDEERQVEEKCREEFSRNGKGKLSSKSVAEAAELAAQGLAFEVVYYPKAGWSDFVLKAEVVDVAMSVTWIPGMRIKMAVETDDSSRTTWFQGVVSSVSVPDHGPWGGSPWRMLQITWDEPEVLQTSKWVSPWQIELLSTTPSLHTPFPSIKRLRGPHGVLTDGDPFSITAFTNSTMGQLNQSLLSYGTFPAGMQGARHDLFSVSSFSNFPGENPRLCMSNSFGNNAVLGLKSLSTELNVGSSQSDDFSPESQNSLPSFGTDFVRNNYCNSMKPGPVSFQLFGAVIQTERPVDSGSHGTGSPGDDSSKGGNETEGMNNPLEDSLIYSKLLDRLDGQHQIASTIEACYL